MLVILSKSLDASKRRLNICWSDTNVTRDVERELKEVSSKYPYVWLRDNCQCPECFHSESNTRKMLMKDLDVNDCPQEVEISEDGSVVEITWQTGHVTNFKSSWLFERRYCEVVNESQMELLRKPINLWGSEKFQNLTKERYNNVLENDAALYQWLVTLEKSGITLLTGAPEEPGALHKLGSRVGFLRITSFGDTFQVRAQMKPTAVPQMNHALDMHTDMSYHSSAPGVLLFHCIKQATSEGGDNMFVDGFQVAEQMRQNYPEHFNLLTTVPLVFSRKGLATSPGSDYNVHHINRMPIISLDPEGKIRRINYSNHIRETLMVVNPDKVDALYHTLKCFNDLLYDEKNCIKMKLNPGDVMCFVNHRVLHARTAFTVMESGERFMEAAYMDVDELNSRRRVLESEMNFHN